MGGTRGKKDLIINNYPNSKLDESGDTGLLLEIRLLEEGGSGICGAELASGERFCISYMDECNTASHNCSKGLRDNLPVGKGGAWVVL